MGKKKADKKGSCNCGDKCDCCNERANIKEKIKVKNLEIIVTGTEEKPYYEIKYESLEDAHPQMREVTIPLLRELQSKIPVVFDDIECSAVMEG